MRENSGFPLCLMKNHAPKQGDFCNEPDPAGSGDNSTARGATLCGLSKH